MKKFGLKHLLLSAALVVGMTPQMRAATINVPADQATLAAAIAVANDGDEIVLAAGNHAGATVDAPSANFDLTIRGASGNRTDVTIGSNGSGSNATCLIVGATSGSLTLNIQDLSILGDAAATGNESALRIGQHTTNTLTVNLSNVLVEHLRVNGNSAVGFTGLAAGTHGAAVNFTAVDSLFQNCKGLSAAANTGGTIATKNGTDSNVGTGSPAANQSNHTVTLDNCQVINGPAGNGIAQDFLGAINLDNGGTAAGAATQNFTLNIINGSLIEGWGINRGTITHGRSTNTRGDGLTINITDSTVKSYGDRALELVKNTSGNPGNYAITLNRSLIDTHEVTSPTQTNAAKGRAIVVALSDNPGTSTLDIFNCVILSPCDIDASIGSGGNNHKKALNAEGNIEMRGYHNTVAALPSATSVGFPANTTNIGNGGFWLNNGGTPTQKVRAHLANNIFWNYKYPIQGNGSATDSGAVAIVPLSGTTSTLNLIVGPQDEPDKGANGIFVNVAAPMLGADELDTSYVPLTGSAAIDAADPSAAISTAISRLDFNGTDRDIQPTWDIGAFETNPVPVELGTFSLE